MHKFADVTAVIVTYHPNLAALNQLCCAIESQVGAIVIVDNTPGKEAWTGSEDFSGHRVIMLGANKGIAMAQNVGIEYAKSLGAKDVLMFDQDSLPTPDMLPNLIEARHRLRSEGISVAAVGPVQKDSRTGKLCGFSVKRGLFSVSQTNPVHAVSQYEEALFVIASGSLISMRVIEQVGLMDESLFIDCVDIEWGFRAGSVGYKSFGVNNAVLQHQLGDEPLKFFNRELVYHSPIRHYYFFRNIIALSKRRYIPTSWKVYRLLFTPIHTVLLCLMSNEKSQQASMMYKGILDGFTNRTGSYDER